MDSVHENEFNILNWFLFQDQPPSARNSTSDRVKTPRHSDVTMPSFRTSLTGSSAVTQSSHTVTDTILTPTDVKVVTPAVTPADTVTPAATVPVINSRVESSVEKVNDVIRTSQDDMKVRLPLVKELLNVFTQETNFIRVSILDLC